jgi:transposase-like protein
MVAAALRQAFLQADRPAARQTWRQVADQLRPRWPKLAGLMDDSEHDVLAYLAFPAQHRTKLHSTDEIDKGVSLLRRSGARRSDRQESGGGARLLGGDLRCGRGRRRSA